MTPSGPPRRERPVLFTFATALLALGLTAGMLWWAYSTPEAVLIGRPGRHDAVRDGARLADCLDCHVPFVGTPGSRCLGPGCHGELATGTPPRVGPAMPVRFHVVLRDYECRRCHTEHQAPRAAPEVFAHEVIPAASRTRCADCHLPGRDAHARTDAVPCDLCHGLEQWRGAKMSHERVQEQPCDLCHAAPATKAHATVAGACDDCHGTGDWATVSP